MRKLKNYFKMMITAVICFVMNFVPGKKGKEVLDKLNACPPKERKNALRILAVYLDSLE